jgi:Protein of unknown function (DUF3098)
MAKSQQRPQSQSQAAPAPAKKAAPVRRTETRESIFSEGSNELIFGRTNYIYIGAGLLLVLFGLAAMSGGAMPDPNKWEPERIYSFRRITLAPILMVAGFVVIGLGIFKSDHKTADTETTQNEA